MAKCVLLAFFFMLPLLGCGSAGPSSQASYQAEEPFPVLNGYGNWIDLAAYGRVWQPTVSSDWAPFVNGEWVWTDQGWMWETDEPFGWVVYHYGYWMQWGAAGWVWVPGDEWSPARVQWYGDEENIGWSPLGPPRAQFPMAYEPGFERAWVFVPASAFVGTNAGRSRYAAPPPRGGRHPLVLTRGPDPREIERHSNARITPRRTLRDDVRTGPRTLTRVRVAKDDAVRPPPAVRQAVPAERPAAAPLPAAVRQSGPGRTLPVATPAPAKPPVRPAPKVRVPPAAGAPRDSMDTRARRPAAPPSEPGKEKERK
jgi:hypothetical protein